MIKVFYGENRVLAGEEIKKFLGEGYEVLEGAEMELQDLINVFLGGSLFTDSRRILIRDLLSNRAASEGLEEYLETPHKIALLELKVDKRSNIYKTLKDKVEFIECKMPRDVNAGVVFDVYSVAKRDGRRAVEMLRRVEQTQDPIMFEGLIISQALKEFNSRPGAKEKKALEELSKLDINLKSSSIEPWLLIESFLLRLNSDELKR